MVYYFNRNDFRCEWSDLSKSSLRALSRWLQVRDVIKMAILAVKIDSRERSERNKFLVFSVQFLGFSISPPREGGGGKSQFRKNLIWGKKKKGCSRSHRGAAQRNGAFPAKVRGHLGQLGGVPRATEDDRDRRLGFGKNGPSCRLLKRNLISDRTIFQGRR